MIPISFWTPRGMWKIYRTPETSGDDTWTTTGTQGAANDGVWHVYYEVRGSTGSTCNSWDTTNYVNWSYHPEPKPKKEPIINDYWPSTILTKQYHKGHKPSLVRNPGGQFKR